MCLIGETLPALKGKNITGLLKFTPAKLNHPTDYDTLITKLLQTAGYQPAMGMQDVNTAIKQAQEQADKVIAEQSAQ